MFIIVMGVSGAGKTTVGTLLAGELGWPFHEGDDFHPARNIEKMRRGEPLTDENRAPWIERLRALIERTLKNGENAVLACSALKHSYRARLRVTDQVAFIYLSARPDLIRQRLKNRAGHFFNPLLAESQLATLETPRGAITIDASLPPPASVQQIRQRLRL